MEAFTRLTGLVAPIDRPNVDTDAIIPKQFLKSKGVESIEEVRVDLDPQARDTMMQSTGRRTVPQIFIGDTHVGGCDDLLALDASGGLAPLLAA